jgi:hypothetical protein
VLPEPTNLSFRCEQCGTASQCEQMSVVVRPPRHLVVSLTRMEYAHNHQKTVSTAATAIGRTPARALVSRCLLQVKYMSYVPLEATLRLPDVQPRYAALLARELDGIDTMSRLYGLYAVIVHSGASSSCVCVLLCCVYALCHAVCCVLCAVRCALCAVRCALCVAVRWCVVPLCVVCGAVVSARCERWMRVVGV